MSGSKVEMPKRIACRHLRQTRSNRAQGSRIDALGYLTILERASATPRLSSVGISKGLFETIVIHALEATRTSASINTIDFSDLEPRSKTSKPLIMRWIGTLFCRHDLLSRITSASGAVSIS